MPTYPKLTDTQWTLQRIMDRLVDGSWDALQTQNSLADITLPYANCFEQIIEKDVRRINVLMASSNARNAFGTDWTKSALTKINTSSMATGKLIYMASGGSDVTAVTDVNTLAASSGQMATVVGSSTGMAHVAGSGTAMSAMDVDVAQTAILGNTTAYGLFLGSAYWPSNFSGSVRYGKAIIGGGTTGSAQTITDKYNLASNATSSSISLGTARWNISANGSSIKGIFGGGYTGSSWVANTDKYTFATDAVISSPTINALTVGREGTIPTGNSVLGLFSGGGTGSGGNSVITDKYSYTTDICIAGSSISTSRGFGGGCSTSTTGYICGGMISGSVTPTAVVEKYIFSTDAKSAGTALGTAKFGTAGCGNTTRGIITGDDSSGSLKTEKYVYIGDSRTYGTDLASRRGSTCGFSNLFVGYFAGASNSYTATVATYTFSNDAISTSNSISQARGALAACSNAHGGLYI